jgi:hypothetical protein
MNWSRGLVRLWIAVSLLWIILSSIYWLSANVLTFAEPPLVAIVIGPPIALFVFGFGVWWIVDGFRVPLRQKNKDYKYTYPS